MSTYEGSFFLCLRQGRYGSLKARIVGRKPVLQVGEICVELAVQVPRALFQRPALRAKVTIPEAGAQAILTADVQHNIMQALEAQLGVRVQLEVSAAEGA